MRRAFVLLPGFVDITDWRDKFRAGKEPDLSPYGYHHAERFGYEVVFSGKSSSTTKLADLIARIAERAFGFDFMHVWQNAEAIKSSRPDVVWTHTENEFLGVLLMRRLGVIGKVPVIAQSVWLVDRWSQLSGLRQRLFGWLLRQADVCTFLSISNHASACSLGWSSRLEVIDFGISLDSFPLLEPLLRAEADPIRVLALGNDRHRDWITLHAALGNNSRFDVRIASKTYPKALACGNIHVGSYTQQGLLELYRWADVVVLPLMHNLHASGITVALEATAMGKPLIATDAGGLKHYFTADELWYVPIEDATELERQVIRVASCSALAEKKVRAAQQTLVRRDFSTRGYAKRHAELSDSLLAAKAWRARA